jgi:peptidoglycan/xylan/chitin deacetylase (PgdA/CDA1 family)
VARTARVPILMYHHVIDPGPSANSLEKDLSVLPVRFEQQLSYLKDAGYETISTTDLIYHLTLGAPLPAKPIIITFDDGYADNYIHAFPLLQKYGFSATFYVVTDYVDRGLSRYMTWEQIEEMAASGMEIGSHSRDHPDLRGKPYEYLVWQILGSRQTIEAHVGRPIHAFSYPSGAYDDFAVQVVRSAHFWGAVTTAQGATHTSDDIFELRRIRVRGTDSLHLFTKKLHLDW